MRTATLVSAPLCPHVSEYKTLRGFIHHVGQRSASPFQKNGRKEDATDAEMQHVAIFMKGLEEGTFNEIICFEKLYEAYLQARKGKRSRKDVGVYSYDLEGNLIQTEEELEKEIYRVGSYHRFFVHEPKKRLVMSLRFKDRVVQWAIYQKIMPFYDKLFISDSFACRKGKGTYGASERLQYWLKAVHRKPGRWYYLKLDISKYFYRVDHEILIEILKRRIHDSRLIRLLEWIINDGEAFGLPPGKNPDEVPQEEWLKDVGMPIGNLTSQLFANIYLNEMDQFCKHVLHIHYYVRYMDDVIILGNDKKALKEIKEKISNFLKEQLRLDLNHKTAIRPVEMGIDFVGFRTWGTYKRIKKSTAKRMRRSVKSLSTMLARGEISRDHFDRCMCSYAGILKRSKSENLKKRLNEIYLEVTENEKKSK